MSIKELVVCKFTGCNQVYNDPRLLPCGTRTCAAHIEAMVLKSDGIHGDKEAIKCHFCTEIHSFPENGRDFPVDKHIQQLLNMSFSIEHEAAKKSFNAVTQLLDNEDYVIDYFERLEAEILLEKEINIQTMVDHYQTLVEDVHERKARCLSNLKMSKTLDSELEPIKQALKEFDSKLKKDNLAFILKTLDGDQAKWKEVLIECDTLMEKIKSLDSQLAEEVVGDETIGFRPKLIVNLPIQCICGLLDTRKFDSLIVSNYQMENNLTELIKLSDYNFELVHRASRDGFGASHFHTKCDNQSGTLTVIKTTNGCIFGAYASVAWNSTSGYKADPKAFIFSLVNVESTPLLIPIRADDKHAILCKSECGPMFGAGTDIFVWHNSNETNESFSNLGKSYDFTLFKFGRVKAQSFLAGSRNFQTLEIEVFTFREESDEIFSLITL